MFLKRYQEADGLSGIRKSQGTRDPCPLKPRVQSGRSKAFDLVPIRTQKQRPCPVGLERSRQTGVLIGR